MTRSILERIEEALAQHAGAAAVDRLRGLERAFHEATKQIWRDDPDAARAERWFVEAGVMPLDRAVSLGRACQPMHCRVPDCESNLARSAGLVPARGKGPWLWTAAEGARLDVLVRWLEPSKLLALRAARGALGDSVSDWAPNYPLAHFVTRLADAARWVEFVATGLESRGVAIERTPYEVRATEADIARFTRYETDLVLPTSRLGIEVKSRTETWTNADDFPFRTMFVDTFSGYLSKLRRPLAYVCVSQGTSAISVIPTFTANDWECVGRDDRDRTTTDGRPLRDRYWAVPTRWLKDFDWLVELCRALETSNDFEVVLSQNGYPKDLARALATRVHRS